MIKVEHTETHVAIPKGKTMYHDVLVAPAKLVLVESQYYAKFSIKPDRTFHLNPLVGIGYKPIFISETEHIHKSDKVYQTVTKEIIDAPFEVPHPYIQDHRYRKILALPEHFTPQQLQMIVDGKLKHGDKILVECEKHLSFPSGKYHWERGEHFRIKLNPHITIYPIEEKMYSKLEMFKILQRAVDPFGGLENLNWGDFDRWFEQNIK